MTKTCPQCGGAWDTPFCPLCGVRLETAMTVCGDCGRAVPATPFCQECGARLDDAALEAPHRLPTQALPPPPTGQILVFARAAEKTGDIWNSYLDREKLVHGMSVTLIGPNGEYLTKPVLYGKASFKGLAVGLWQVSCGVRSAAISVMANDCASVAWDDL